LPAILPEGRHRVDIELSGGFIIGKGEGGREGGREGGKEGRERGREG